MLVNKLSVADARRLLRNEGGGLGRGELLVQVLTVGVVSFLMARSILSGHLKTWHLLLPMIAQYVALLMVMPVVYAVVRHPELRRDARLSMVWLAAAAMVLAIILGIRAARAGLSFREEAMREASGFVQALVRSGMVWPVIAAVAGLLTGLPRRLRNLFEHGPPFVAAGIGCGTRLAVPLFGCFLLPVVAANRQYMAWYIWAILLIGDLLALWLVWDVQERLQKYDEARGGRGTGPKKSGGMDGQATHATEF